MIVSDYTYTASAFAVLHCGTTVAFVDSQKDGNSITHIPEKDYAAMEAAITEHTKTIIPVDLGGIICDYERIYQAVENEKHLF